MVTFDRLCSSVLFVRGVFASDCDCWHGDGQIRLVLRVAFLLLFPVEGCLECGGGGRSQTLTVAKEREREGERVSERVSIHVK